jgi:HSP20 family protein
LWELHDQVERAFRGLTVPAEVSPVWRPPTDVLEDEEAYWIRFDLPGVKAEEITLEVAEGSVWLSGERAAIEGEERVLRSECRYGRFGASVPLPRDAAPEGITARLEAGVLTVKVPRRAGAVMRRIDIETQ